jgi:hypothetical protein
MEASRRPLFVEETDLEPRTGSHRRDSDCGGYPRSHEEDLAWTARRAAVSIAAATMHARDGGTGAHSDDVVLLCEAIADELGVHGHDRAELLAAAQLHDVGKITISQEVLDKPGPLDEDEWAAIRRHTVAGEQILKAVPELTHVACLVRHSHERWDGGGYPDALAREQIPLASRIVFCADAFHAIRSDRPYRRGASAETALKEVKASAGTQFDPVVVAALVKSARQTRTSAGRGTSPLARSVRSRRLLSLLLTLAIGSSALAAGGALSGDGDDAASSSSSVPASAAGADAPEAGAAKHGKTAAARRARRRAGDRANAASGDRAGAKKANVPASGRGTSGSPATALSAANPTIPAAPRRSGVGRRNPPGRIGNPGRSQEAPGRPAVPGKPVVGGAPGRSEAAPGKPTGTPGPPAGQAKPNTAPASPPASTLPARAPR